MLCPAPPCPALPLLLSFIPFVAGAWSRCRHRRQQRAESGEEQRAESGEEQRAESREEQSAESTEEQRAEMSRDLHPSAVSSRVQTKGPYEVCLLSIIIIIP